MSGLTKRVRGVNLPQGASAGEVRGGGRASAVPELASVDVVTSLLEHLTQEGERERDR